ncbi:DUF5949 family protein [Streptomyces sp. CB03238]|uniref:DUF5949 family protein n=1 Tax=Streptomyces sp. CB03238 TaxID=1907777 RepID=UPI000A10078E|nr:DUF5949 family protein [Streptomyces sp. CB03238]ORT59078.1 hypothetical protein BKD26_13670 [Streptomyces sp. CB03238]
MTSSTAATPGQQESLLGTLTVIPWVSEPESDAGTPVTPFLMVYSLGDGRDGTEAGAEALRAELEKIGLSIGDKVTDLSRETRIPVTLLVEAEQAVLNLPFMKVQCPVPPEWEKAAHESGTAYLICALRPWPEAVQGKPVGEEQLRAFLGEEEMVAKSAHCLVPVRRVRT